MIIYSFVTDFSKTWPEEFLFSFLLGFFIFYSWILIDKFFKENLKKNKSSFCKIHIFFPFFNFMFVSNFLSKFTNQKRRCFLFYCRFYFWIDKNGKKVAKTLKKISILKDIDL